VITVLSDSYGLSSQRMQLVKFSSRLNRYLHFSLRGAAGAERVEKWEGDGQTIGRITSSYAANVGREGAVMSWIKAISVQFIGRITRKLFEM
jgi:hypothetical protein